MNDHAIIRNLIHELRVARNAILVLESDLVKSQEATRQTAEALYEAEDRIAMRTARLRAELSQAEREAEDARSEADSRSYDRRRALDDLERAQQWGDEYGAERARERLRRLS